jgi:formylglycine-generating enzyme required for sulfatase activity
MVLAKKITMQKFNSLHSKELRIFKKSPDLARILLVNLRRNKEMKRMRKINIFCGMAILALVFAGCSNPAGTGGVTILPGPGDGKTVSVGGLPEFALRYVPATPDEGFRRDSNPNNLYVLTKGFWMGETEVTQELWLAVMGNNPSMFNGSTGKEAAPGEDQNKRPIENVSWFEVLVFCNKLSVREGKTPVYAIGGSTDPGDWGAVPSNSATPDSVWNAAVMVPGTTGYRLPTEMEWMWAAMGATDLAAGYQKAYAGSKEGSAYSRIGEYAWYQGNADSKTHEVGKLATNELGLYDMTGNAVEWCWDFYDSSYPSGLQKDTTGVGTYRVIRGGHYLAQANNCSVGSHINANYNPSAATNIGFRIVCAAE